MLKEQSNDVAIPNLHKSNRNCHVGQVNGSFHPPSYSALEGEKKIIQLEVVDKRGKFLSYPVLQLRGCFQLSVRVCTPSGRKARVELYC